MQHKTGSVGGCFHIGDFPLKPLKFCDRTAKLLALFHVAFCFIKSTCGHTKGKKVVSTEEMVARITVASEAREGDDAPLIIARSDARQPEDVDSMIRRLEAYTKAGADLLFPEALSDEEEMAYVTERLSIPAIVNMADGGDTKILPAATLKELGFAGALFPATTALASAAASIHALKRLKESGTSIHEDVELFSFAEMCSLIGFEEVYELDRQWAHLNA